MLHVPRIIDEVRQIHKRFQRAAENKRDSCSVIHTEQSDTTTTELKHPGVESYAQKVLLSIRVEADPTRAVCYGLVEVIELVNDSTRIVAQRVRVAGRTITITLTHPISSKNSDPGSTPDTHRCSLARVAAT